MEVSENESADAMRVVLEAGQLSKRGHPEMGKYLDFFQALFILVDSFQIAFSCFCPGFYLHSGYI